MNCEWGDLGGWGDRREKGGRIGSSEWVGLDWFGLLLDVGRSVE